MFASDGMRPDLMEKYAKAGSMPTYKKLMKDGATGDNGMLQAFPPNTGVGWFTMATGTYPSEHGSTNNTFHRGGDSFANSTSFSAGILQADTIGAAAERAGRRSPRSTGSAAPRPDSTARQSISRPSTTTVACSSARRSGRAGRRGGVGTVTTWAQSRPRAAGPACPRATRRRPQRRRPGRSRARRLGAIP